MTLEELIQYSEKSEISSIPNIIHKILEIVRNQYSNANDLRKTIEMDPPLASRVLKLANSAYYGKNERINTLLEAIIRVGFNAVKELTLTQKVCELFENKNEISGYSSNKLWQHSVGVALCSKLIYRKALKLSGENIYCIGLIHDLGIVIEEQILKKDFYSVLKNAHDHKKDLLQSEKDMLGFTHSNVGEELSKKWRFPNDFIFAIGKDEQFVHDEQCIENDKINKDLAIMSNTLLLSNIACRMYDIGYKECHNGSNKTYNQCLGYLKISEKGINLIMCEVKNTIETMHKDGWF